MWWRLHEAVTRNHRCQPMEELRDRAFDWFDTRTAFRVEPSMSAECLENEDYFRVWREVS